MSDKGPVYFGGKEKCLIGVYVVATATSTILFTATLVIVMQSQSDAHNSNLTGANATGNAENQVSDFKQDISKLNQEIELIHFDAKNRTNGTEKLKKDTAALMNQMNEIQINLTLLQAQDIDRSLCSLGVFDRNKVPDGSMSSSSEYSGGYGAYRGRLNGDSSWFAKDDADSIGQWIEVDFGATKKIRGVMTQGSSIYNQWVKSYKLSCGLTKRSQKNLTDSSGYDKVYTGNSDGNSIVTHLFSSAKYCRYTRIYPQAHEGQVTLRMDWITDCL